ncbi:energy transducer TonB [Thiobacillus sp.]|uniref:energy transducer TonB n=2 Tax=Thiobacillus sp. TaxID=924 RepID=UPI0025D37C7E|nr:energy transducer TonB [Thiobacillus sp.]
MSDHFESMVSSAPAPSPALAAPSKQGTRMALALLASAAVHGMVLSTQFVHVNPHLFEDPNLPMEVVLVNAKSVDSPLNPDALAQVNLAGGGNTDEDRRLKSPLPASARTQTGTEEAALQAKVASLEQQAKTLLSQLKPDAQLQTPPPVEPPAPVRPTVDASQLNEQAREMAQLQARISQQWDEYQKRPKRAFVGANVREYAFARYVEDWVTKVERIGNVNYPEAARRQGIYGSLRLTVSIYANGRIETVDIDRSSGSKILDAAAIKIVELAAPYAPFPDEMRKKADILSITRTWTFTRSDQLVGTD